jgi:hypothetical protein
MNFEGNNKYSYEYIPEYDAPLGFQNVSFLIYNETSQLLNSHTTYTNFTIDTNYLVTLYDQIEGTLSSEFYIEDIVDARVKVWNISKYNYDFTWNTTIVDSSKELILALDKNQIQYTFPVANETFIKKDHFYYIQLNMTDKNSGRKETAYFPFYVRNNDPIISSSIDLNPVEVFRTDDCTISFNATDIETLSKNLIPSIRIFDAEGNFVLQRNIEFVSENLFSDTFAIPANKPIGQFRIELIVRDELAASYIEEIYLTVKNNPPEINSYNVNGLNMDQSISVPYGRNLVFTFNVSDIEEVSYVKIALLNGNNEWFNITRKYIGQDTEISIRTIDLIGGIWYVYIYVIDSDGSVTSLIDDYDKAPQGIRIIPDVFGDYLPWILLFAGVGIGFVVGVVIIYSYLKTKYVESQKVTPKKKEITKKPIAKKKVKKEELERKDIEEPEPIKEEEEEGVPKRKIKRKL